MVAKPKEVTTAIKRYVNEQNVTEILPQKNAPGMQHKRARVLDGGHFMTGDEYIKSMQDKESEKKTCFTKTTEEARENEKSSRKTATARTEKIQEEVNKTKQQARKKSCRK